MICPKLNILATCNFKSHWTEDRRSDAYPDLCEIEKMRYLIYALCVLINWLKTNDVKFPYIAYDYSQLKTELVSKFWLHCKRLYTTWDGAWNGLVFLGVLGRSTFATLFLQSSFEFNENLHLFLQRLPSVQELFLLCLVELVHLVQLHVQTFKKLLGRISVSKLLQQLCLIHIPLTCRASEFLMNLYHQHQRREKTQIS